MLLVFPRYIECYNQCRSAFIYVDLGYVERGCEQSPLKMFVVIFKITWSSPDSYLDVLPRFWSIVAFSFVSWCAESKPRYGILTAAHHFESTPSFTNQTLNVSLEAFQSWIFCSPYMIMEIKRKQRQMISTSGIVSATKFYFDPKNISHGPPDSSTRPRPFTVIAETLRYLVFGCTWSTNGALNIFREIVHSVAE